jgi:[ribosomal protein S5]-alanine N-acetyltransferase
VPRLTTSRLELRPLPAGAAAALPGDRAEASRILGAAVPPDWPLVDLLDILPMQASSSPDDEPYGIWVMIDPETQTVLGDIGFAGRPDGSGSVEIGYSVLPGNRRRGYAGEAVAPMVAWALAQDGVTTVIADSEQDNEASIRTLERSGFVRTGASGSRIHWRYAGDG